MPFKREYENGNPPTASPERRNEHGGLPSLKEVPWGALVVVGGTLVV